MRSRVIHPSRLLAEMGLISRRGQSNPELPTPPDRGAANVA